MEAYVFALMVVEFEFDILDRIKKWDEKDATYAKLL